MPLPSAVEAKIVLKHSLPLHPISPSYRSILLLPPGSERGPIPLLSTSAPISISRSSVRHSRWRWIPFATCEDFFKVRKCEAEKLVHGVTMPLVLQPQEEAYNNGDNDMKSLFVALEKNSDWFKQMIVKHGAVLLRGFEVSNAEDFNGVVETLGWDHVPYVGPAPRTHVCKRIWTANEGPLSEPIDFHHEMAIVKGYPEYVMFFCEVPPLEGGETPIVPSCRVAERMMEEFPEAVKEMEEKGWKYSFRAPLQATASYMGKGWSEGLGSSDPAEAVKWSKAKADMDVQWLPDGSANVTMSPRPLTMAFNGRKGRKVWFNIINIMHKKEITSVLMMDGTEIPENVVKRMREIIEEESIQFRWEKGDILFLDNLAVCHGRRASSPPRKVLIATCKVASV